MKKLHKNLLMILIIILFFNVVLYMLSDTIDDFSPRHIGASWMIMNDRVDFPGIKWLFDRVPGYYIFIAQFILITGIDYISIPTAPIILFPYVITFFCFFYILSKKKIYLTTLILLFMFSSAIRGTHLIFIWADGMGEIIYYTILLMFLFDRSKWQYNLLMILSLLALPFISYNMTFNAICFLIMFLFFGIRKLPFQNIENQRILILISLPIIVEFGLMYFVYNAYIPLMSVSNLGSNLIMSVVKFIKYLFGQSISQEIMIKEFAISVPKEIMIISIFKYAMLSSFTLLTMKKIYKKNLQKGSQNSIRLFLSLFCAVLLFVFVKSLLGNLAILKLAFPSFVAITILCEYNIQGIKYKKLVYFSLIVLIITNFTVMYISQQSGIVQKDNYSYIQQSAIWTSTYVTNDVFIPDQLTLSWFYLHFCYLESNITRKYLSNDDILAIYTGDKISSGKFIVINYRSNYNQIHGWIKTKSFISFRGKIEMNPSVKGKIYALNEDIVIIMT